MFLLQATAIAPALHFSQLDEKLEQTKILSNQFLKKIGLEVAQQGMKVEGKVMKRPNVVYRNGQGERVRKEGRDCLDCFFFV